MVNFKILAGGFSTFIATYVFDSDASTLTLVKQTPTGTNPSWIASHLHNTSILYATNENSPVGSLQSFVVDAHGGLTLRDTITTGGNGPTFTNPLTTGEVTGMNMAYIKFGSPNSSFVATDPRDPTIFRRDTPQFVDFPVGDGPSNPHMSLEHNGEVLCADLGANKIWRVVNQGGPGDFRVQGQINIDAGAGPRHMAIHDEILFTVHETVSTLTAQRIPAAPNGTTFPLIANVSVTPTDFPEGAKFAAAELLISTPTKRFPNPLIYVSNRNIGTTIDPRGDTIAIFEFQNSTESSSSYYYQPRANAEKAVVKRGGGGALVLVGQFFTGLQQIRSMSLGRVVDGGDEFLVAGANTEGGVAVFRREDEGRSLVLVARNPEIANRTSFVFV